MYCPDSAGRLDDVVLGARDAEQQVKSGAYFGASIGRLAGRVLNASMPFQGRTLKLSRNSGKHHLHGGAGGFSRNIWEAHIPDSANPTVAFRHRFPAGTDGYPGNLDVVVSWELSPPCTLTTTISAVCPEATPFNPTIHPYFNLNGHSAGSIDSHRICLDATRYLPLRNDRLAVGYLAAVEGTRFDTRNGARIAQLRGDRAIGLDHTFVMPRGGFDTCRLMLTSEESRRVLRVYSDRTCLHLYDGSGLEGCPAKGGASYKACSGLAIEPQDFPDAHNHAQFPAFTLQARQRFETRTSFVFSTLEALPDVSTTE